MTASIKVISTSYLYSGFCHLPFYSLIIYLLIQCMFLDFVTMTFSLPDLIEDSLYFLFISVEAEMLELKSYL